jgi:hypothetical protein
MRRGRGGRRLAAVLLWAFAIAAAAGVFGVRSGGVSTATSGLRAQVHFPRVSRPGEPANWSVQVDKQAGFRGDLRVTTNDSYLALFDQNNVDPQPDETDIQGGRVTWTFHQPSGDTFEVQLDGNIDSNAHAGRHRGTTTVAVDGKTVTLHYSTWTAP